MVLFIESVQISAEYDNKVYNYWISAKMNDGKVIKIFDYSCLNVFPNVSTYIECQLFANLSTPGQGASEIEGKYIGRRGLKNWKRVMDDRGREKEYPALETSSGIIMFSDMDAEREYLEGETIQLHVIRFDLIAVNS